MTRVKVFISYSHCDNSWRERLVKHLGVLAREDLIDVWDDEHINPGVSWRDEIDTQMSQAQIAVFLVSASFLTSDFVRVIEVPNFLERHERDGMTIYPLLVSPCAWEHVPWLKRLNLRPPGARAVALARGPEREKILANVASEIARIVAAGANIRAEFTDSLDSTLDARLYAIRSLLSTPNAPAPGRCTELLQFVSALKPEELEAWIAPLATYCDRTSNATERQKLVVQLREANSQLVLQLLPHLTTLGPEDGVRILVTTEGWDGIHLSALAQQWLRRGLSVSDIRRVLIGLINERHSISELACLCYALDRNELMDPTSFFECCQRWRNTSPPLFETVRIPPNTYEKTTTFLMGSTAQSGGLPNEFPQRRVTLNAFHLMTHPVTERQYHLFDPERDVEHAENPVACVNWWEAWLFCQWAKGQLPTEAQWECACRAGTSSLWWTGDAEDDLTIGAWYAENTADAWGTKYSRQPVKVKAPNNWGLYDMAGNVLEWCDDWFGLYPSHALTDPRGPDIGNERVLRGGCYRGIAGHLRSAYRGDKRSPHLGLDDFGFRVAFIG